MRSMMGIFTPVWDYVMAHSEQAFSLLAVWVGIYLIARYQVKLIKQKTAALCIEETKKILKKRPNLTSKGLYKEIYPIWEEKVSKFAYFIPHRLDFYPVRVNAKNVLEKFEFNPEWLAEVLKINGVNLPEFSKK
jgi:hypothetical protein